jgi:3-oxoadipate enol-lactonase/4-carboxymuconolactone decarboxylase
MDRHPEAAGALLDALRDTHDAGYVRVCAALKDFDVRTRLTEIAAPVLAVAGAHDKVAPVGVVGAIADGVRDGHLVELDDVSHLAPAEAPEEVARLIRGHALGVGHTDDHVTVQEVRDAGMAVRREVLGDEHVDRAAAGATDFTRDFQELITQYAWGTIWTRPGLDRRSRSLITLTALVARGHHEELALHLRAARTNGVTVEEIKELLLQTAIYCGVPDANTAFRIAQSVLDGEQP